MQSGIRTAAGRRNLFGGDPPVDQSPTGYDVDVSPFWQVLLDDAVREGVLNEDEVSLWSKALFEIPAVDGTMDQEVARRVQEEITAKPARPPRAVLTPEQLQ
ncbi:hypothetical protein SEUCBS140593_006760 [Sporothrix eucalyptigena]|uniref:Uncharacterized protein n=1 Tax=Sporothrix eucalyptigena TaxID=1812306 RepID=A0ABP0C7I5_9PEZI